MSDIVNKKNIIINSWFIQQQQFSNNIIILSHFTTLKRSMEKQAEYLWGKVTEMHIIQTEVKL